MSSAPVEKKRTALTAKVIGGSLTPPRKKQQQNGDRKVTFNTPGPGATDAQAASSAAQPVPSYQAHTLAKVARDAATQQKLQQIAEAALDKPPLLKSSENSPTQVATKGSAEALETKKTPTSSAVWLFELDAPAVSTAPKAVPANVDNASENTVTVVKPEYNPLDLASRGKTTPAQAAALKLLAEVEKLDIDVSEKMQGNWDARQYAFDHALEIINDTSPHEYGVLVHLARSTFSFYKNDELFRFLRSNAKIWSERLLNIKSDANLTDLDDIRSTFTEASSEFELADLPSAIYEYKSFDEYNKSERKFTVLLERIFGIMTTISDSLKDAPSADRQIDFGRFNGTLSRLWSVFGHVDEVASVAWAEPKISQDWLDVELEAKELVNSMRKRLWTVLEIPNGPRDIPDNSATNIFSKSESALVKELEHLELSIANFEKTINPVPQASASSAAAATAASAAVPVQNDEDEGELEVPGPMVLDTSLSAQVAELGDGDNGATAFQDIPERPSTPQQGGIDAVDAGDDEELEVPNDLDIDIDVDDYDLFGDEDVEEDDVARESPQANRAQRQRQRQQQQQPQPQPRQLQLPPPLPAHPVHPVQLHEPRPPHSSSDWRKVDIDIAYLITTTSIPTPIPRRPETTQPLSIQAEDDKDAIMALAMPGVRIYGQRNKPLVVGTSVL
jgi:hypothetical protein